MRNQLMACALTMTAASARAAEPPLLPAKTAAALAGELSGESARRTVDVLAGHHRMRGSRGFHAAAAFVAERLRAAGLTDAEVLRFPADGRAFYGTQKSRRPWDADFAELWALDAGGARTLRIASWDALPLSLAQDSESGEATADLVDVGAGTADADYAGKEVADRLVLASSQPSAVQRLAVDARGAAGIVSDAQNQRTAWWGEDASLVRWGHLDTFAARPTFAFMVSPAQARAWRDRLARGESVRLWARVVAGQHDGAYEVVTATLPGGDPALREQEVAFSCHLDHPSPGANDNASGCAAILEAARALSRLVADGRIPRPARTLRWIFPPEIEGTITLLNARPELAGRMRAVVHMDMVGGGIPTGAVFHVTRGPASLPSFVNDVAEAVADFVNGETEALAAGRATAFPLTAQGGDKRALQAVAAPFSMGSDHEVYTDSTFGIPAVYLNDWPDRYIHTHRDVPENIDASKLERAAFIGAATALALADAGAGTADALWRLTRAASLARTARFLARAARPGPEEQGGAARFHLWHERAAGESLARFVPITPALRQQLGAHAAATAALLGPLPPEPVAQGDAALVYRRQPRPRGPLTAFGYDYLTDRLGPERVKALALLRHEGARGDGGEYAYEALNLADGTRSVRQVRDALSAIYGPVPVEAVAEYLRALASIGLLAPVN
jgi:hypothetical protein